MAVKFSQFTTGSTLADLDYFVGYKGSDNIQVAKALVTGTTYTVDVPTLTTNINLAGSDSTNDAITLTPGTGITITRDSASELTIASTVVGDITEVIAGDGLSGGGASGDVTLSLATTSAGTGLSYSSGVINLDAHTGDVTGTTALTIATDAVVTAKILDDNVTYAKIQDTSTANRVLGAVAAGVISEVQVATDMIADDAVSYTKVADEFTTLDTLSAAASVDVSFAAAQVFTLTPDQNTTFNITNAQIGITKTMIVTGAGSTYTADTWTVAGGAGTFNKIAGTYDDTSSTKNFYQITCVGATEFWYSISQIGS